LHSESGKPKIQELSIAIKIRGIKNDVIMDMGFICMGGYDKSMAAFGEAQG
jgi:hypothetical protein